jgi:allantoin racemase
VAQIEAAARQALAADRSGAIVLGCGGMAALCRTLQQRLGVPVVDGVSAAVKMAEALVALGLKTEKTGRLRAAAAQALGGLGGAGWATPTEGLRPGLRALRRAPRRGRWRLTA